MKDIVIPVELAEVSYEGAMSTVTFLAGTDIKNGGPCHLTLRISPNTVKDIIEYHTKAPAQKFKLAIMAVS